jgi:hypothetical protein
MYLDKPFDRTHPSTWPWFFYIWLGVTIAIASKPIWSRFKLDRTKSWSSAPGRIESVDVTLPKVLFVFNASKDSSATHVAELRYSYSAAGTAFAGVYKREFPTEWEAWEFLRDLSGKPVTVLLNPDKPSSSTLSESAIETLLQTRPQISEEELLVARTANSVPSRLTPFLSVFVALSGIGFVVSLCVNIASLMGRQTLPEAFFAVLHIGIFVVWVPAVFLAKQRVGSTHRKDFWKLVLKGAPDWMRYFVYAVFIYSFVVFFLSMANSPAGSGQIGPSGWRQFSAVWMDFYSGAFAIHYAVNAESVRAGKCLNGHAVSPGANFCTQCGQPVRRTL